jgi:cytochrome b6-f complex iron-sulfur subunit
MQKDPQIARRQLITAAGAGWLALSGSVVAGAWATCRFMQQKVPADQNVEIEAGPADHFASLPAGHVREAAPATGVWIVRLPGRIIAIDATCTHLGCRTAWATDDMRFQCPCHGSSFAIDGTNLDGPAPRALDRLAICVRDGRVIVDRSRRFRKERGEWEYPDSFVAI